MKQRSSSKAAAPTPTLRDKIQKAEADLLKALKEHHNCEDKKAEEILLALGGSWARTREIDEHRRKIAKALPSVTKALDALRDANIAAFPEAWPTITVRRRSSTKRNARRVDATYGVKLASEDIEALRELVRAAGLRPQIPLRAVDQAGHDRAKLMRALLKEPGKTKPLPQQYLAAACAERGLSPSHMAKLEAIMSVNPNQRAKLASVPYKFEAHGKTYFADPRASVQRWSQIASAAGLGGAFSIRGRKKMAPNT